jgi:hypothetical protein
MSTLQQFQVVTATIRQRLQANGNALKPGVQLIDGKQINLRVLWLIEDDDDRYPGEWALGGADARANAVLRAAEISWIASGDVEVHP